MLAESAEYPKQSIKSGHGVGKSALDSWRILQFMSCYYPCKIPCCAPTLHQLKDILWSELAIWWKMMPEGLRNQFEMKSSDQDMRFYLRSDPEASFAVARTGRKENPEALQGFHSDNLLFLLDEASGIDDVVFQVAHGALSSEGSRVLLSSNPTRTSGFFFETHNKLRDSYRRYTVSCYDSPRVTQTYIDEVAKAYGEDSDIFRVRVLGEFPHASDSQFIPRDIVEAAMARRLPAEVYDRHPKVAGMDVARFGDDRTIIRYRQGLKVGDAKKWKGIDTMEAADRAVEAINKDGLDLLFIDEGGLGAGVVDRLKQLGYRRKIIAVNAGSKADDPDQYYNKRAEMWGEMKAFLPACELPKDEDLLQDLIGPEYSFSPKQQLKLERKEDMKRRGRASPDDGDALALTFAKRVGMGTSFMGPKTVKYPDLGVV